MAVKFYLGTTVDDTCHIRILGLSYISCCHLFDITNSLPKKNYFHFFSVVLSGFDNCFFSLYYKCK